MSALAGSLLGALALVPPAVVAQPLPLRAIEATAAEPGFPPEAAVDGLVSGTNGWSVRTRTREEQFIVFAPAVPLDAVNCLIQLQFPGPLPHDHFGDFEVDVTSDPEPTVRGRWAPLIVEECEGDGPGGVVAFGATVRIERQVPVTRANLRARLPFGGVTGFRLRLFPHTPGPPEAPGGVIGHGPGGGFLLSEVRVEAAPRRSSNLALGRQAYCSRAVAARLPTRNLTDGFHLSYSHPDPGGNAEAFYELDLGQMVELDHITLRGRRDGPENERLAAYRVELLTEAGGFPGQTLWLSRPPLEERLQPPELADVIRAAQGEGRFAGRLLRIHNQSHHRNQPLLAEIEVYPALRPAVVDWLAAGREPARDGQDVRLTATARQVRFRIVARPPGANDVVAAYRWRVAGWRDHWEETDAEGRVVWPLPPPPGNHQLEVQARHTDGLWDTTGEVIAVEVLVPWWQQPGVTAAAAATALLLVVAAWWRWKAGRIRRVLAAAEQRLELQQERLRIARDMHDEMGARLTHLALLADRARHETAHETGQTDAPSHRLLGELADHARQAVGALDAIVWAVNPRHDSVGDLADYLADYAPNYLRPAELECRLDLQIENPALALGLTRRHALIMTLKEALQNVVRHARATTVTITLRQRGHELTVDLCDDGRGWSQAATGSTHSGLDNMRQRLAEVGGQCEFRPGPDGQGACVCLRLPLDENSSRT